MGTLGASSLNHTPSTEPDSQGRGILFPRDLRQKWELLVSLPVGIVPGHCDAFHQVMLLLAVQDSASAHVAAGREHIAHQCPAC